MSLPICVIVAASSSVSDERSDTLLLERCTLSETSPAILSIFFELPETIPSMPCNLSIKVLIPIPRAEISSSDCTVILFVRSPFLSSISLIISSISFLLLTIGDIIFLCTTTAANKNATTHIVILTILVTNADI